MEPKKDALHANAVGGLIGRDILNLITVGMYNEPLAVYREYLQNSADAVQANARAMSGQVHIDIDPHEMTVTIRDNGPGLSFEDALRDLIPVALSRKHRGTDRGFRGIGRLSGLAFSEAVRFRTRADSRQEVTEVLWDGAELRRNSVGGRDVASSIWECIHVSKFPGRELPDHFFEVKLTNISRHAASLILNDDAVRKYVSETCPVPVSDQFPFRKEVDSLFEGREALLSLRVFVGDDEFPLHRNYGPALHFSKGRIDRFHEFEDFRVPKVDSDDTAAIGWLAHSSYFGAIPKGEGVRGLRAREGNIQVGDEQVFDHLFPEERFNRWCVGELHVVDPRIVPNARRDYFEPSPHTRNLENRLKSVIRSVVRRCRQASARRNRSRRAWKVLSRCEEALNLARSGYLMVEDSQRLVDQALAEIESLIDVSAVGIGLGIDIQCEVRSLSLKLTEFEPQEPNRFLENFSRDSHGNFRHVFGRITRMCESPKVARDMIESIWEGLDES